MNETEYCTQCGYETLLPMVEGVCGDCHADNYARLQEQEREQERETVTVTREMAMDSGCQEMEGAQIKW